MKKAMKDAWLAALRSGKYRQGSGNLRKYDSKAKKSKFCCLGVLCEVNGVAYQDYDVYGIKEYLFSTRSKDEEVIPRTWLRKWGLNPDLMDDLVSKNDDYEWSFKKIADHIEKKVRAT